ncbi:MAG: metallopeptidase family protein [Dehalococcoidia bacterium]|nr:metallopeptidase family protein [Dehalococcoidia bacterium]
MQRETFEEQVAQAISSLPEEFRQLLDNVEIFVEDWPSKEQLKSVGLRDRHELLGLYEGTPITHRDQSYNLVLPDRITIFQKPLEAQCGSEAEIKREIIKTVKHEIAHYFGMDEDRLNSIENRGGN